MIEEKENKLPVYIDLKLKITVDNNSFLHIGASPSPITEKKGAVFQVDGIPVIPATSFKGALRSQLEILFITQTSKLAKMLNISDDNLLKPCIPAPRPSFAEKQLIDDKKYRVKYCNISSEENGIKIEDKELGICPVCYFTGAAGIMGFIRFDNFFPTNTSSIIDHTNIRIDRKTGTAADRAMVNTEQVKPNTIFTGNIRIVHKETPEKGYIFGEARKIDKYILDKWLLNMQSANSYEVLIKEILIPAIKNIKELGGYKSKGGGKVNIQIDGY